MDVASPDDFTAFGLTDKEHFSLFVHYPDLDFDPEAETNADKMHKHHPSHDANDAGYSYSHFSSPESNLTEHEESESFLTSSSTTHTTPSRHPTFGASSSHADEYTSYNVLLSKSDLPSVTVDYFENLGQQVVHLGSLVQHLSQRQDPFSLEFDSIVKHSAWLHSQLASSHKSTTAQISTIESLLLLRTFAITPTDLSVWSIYRQRIQLITKHLSLPALTEHRLLESLLTVFDAYVYNPFLQLTCPKSDTVVPSVIRNAIHNLYDVVCQLVTTYHKWLAAMRSLKSNYLAPLMRRVEESTFIQREIKQSEGTISVARAVLESGRVVVPRKYENDVVAGAVRLMNARVVNAVATFGSAAQGNTADITNTAGNVGTRPVPPSRDEARTRRWRRQMAV